MTDTNPDTEEALSPLAVLKNTVDTRPVRTEEGRPIQDRSWNRLKSIVDASKEILSDPEVGRDKFTTAMVAEKAGCSIGTIYRYFPDRIAIMDFVWPDRGDTFYVEPQPSSEES